MRTGLALTGLCAGVAVAATPSCVWAAGDGGSVWRTDRPIKAVVLGGSISKYYAGNFGQYLEFGCKNLEVINRGEVGAGARKVLTNLRDEVLGKADVRGGMGKGWVLVQGGLNSVWAPESSSWWLGQVFAEAHAAGLQVAALSLSPWGSDDDPRFAGWKGLSLHRATEHVVDFVLGRLKPEAAYGRRAAQRTGPANKWQEGELPDLAVDLWRSPLRAGQSAPLRDAEPLRKTFGKSPWAKKDDEREQWIARAQATPRQYMAATYRDFDHIHPNGPGHRLMAALTCQKAPEAWGCDCDAIRHATWKGKVVPAANGRK